MKTRNTGQSGFTLVEIMIVVAIIGLLATIATPTWVRARTTSQTHTCINNLKQIDGAKQQWALENKQGPTVTPSFGDISGYLKNTVLCPAGGATVGFNDTYQMNNVGTKPQCLIVPDSHILPETIN